MSYPITSSDPRTTQDDEFQLEVRFQGEHDNQHSQSTDLASICIPDSRSDKMTTHHGGEDTKDYSLLPTETTTTSSQAIATDGTGRSPQRENLRAIEGDALISTSLHRIPSMPSAIRRPSNGTAEHSARLQSIARACTPLEPVMSSEDGSEIEVSGTPFTPVQQDHDGGPPSENEEYRKEHQKRSEALRQRMEEDKRRRSRSDSRTKLVRSASFSPVTSSVAHNHPEESYTHTSFVSMPSALTLQRRDSSCSSHSSRSAQVLHYSPMKLVTSPNSSVKSQSLFAPSTGGSPDEQSLTGMLTGCDHDEEEEGSV